ncbi:MAG: hypothetical protein HY544_04980 [Candidatus Diapherotrites archaeon]|uniref:Uncharacterized protein n=1 Tax=Candidatus Iainarchaeum sp. TaxID=3101447 RepID=A0A8T3YQ09_9ARCH|nr:hypothetical protein [Candidatus Diapherotrites archaeon]
MLQINTSFMPYRLVLSRKEPVKLKVTIRNAGGEEMLASYEIRLPPMLSLDKSGFRGAHTNRIGSFASGAEITEYFEIHARPMTQKGEHTINIKAYEHYNNYEFVKRQYKKDLGLVVDE